jgi:hypothetical protein
MNVHYVCHSTGWKIKFFFIVYPTEVHTVYCISCGEVQPTQGLGGYSYINIHTYTHRHKHEPEANGPVIIPVVRQASNTVRNNIN